LCWRLLEWRRVSWRKFSRWSKDAQCMMGDRRHIEERCDFWYVCFLLRVLIHFPVRSMIAFHSLLKFMYLYTKWSSSNRWSTKSSAVWGGLSSKHWSWAETPPQQLRDLLHFLVHWLLSTVQDPQKLTQHHESQKFPRYRPPRQLGILLLKHQRQKLASPLYLPATRIIPGRHKLLQAKASSNSHLKPWTSFTSIVSFIFILLQSFYPAFPNTNKDLIPTFSLYTLEGAAIVKLLNVCYGS
jgi:hypothetical protein